MYDILTRQVACSSPSTGARRHLTMLLNPLTRLSFNYFAAHLTDSAGDTGTVTQLTVGSISDCVRCFLADGIEDYFNGYFTVYCDAVIGVVYLDGMCGITFLWAIGLAVLVFHLFLLSFSQNKSLLL